MPVQFKLMLFKDQLYFYYKGTIYVNYLKNIDSNKM